MPANISSELKIYLCNPRENLRALNSQLNSMKYYTNPFFDSNISSNQVNIDIHQHFYEGMIAELDSTKIAIEKFKKIVDEINALDNRSQTFAQIYHQILALIPKIQEAGIALIAFAFEIYKAGYLNALLFLQDKKSAMQ